MGGGSKAPEPPKLQAPREVPVEETYTKYLQQREQVPALQDFAQYLNQVYRGTLETGLPGTISSTRQVSTLVNQLLGGELPAESQAEVQRIGAQRALAAGLPGTSQIQMMGEARDVGMTSIGMMQTGASYVPGLMQLSSFLSPQTTQNYIFSTGQLREEALQQAQAQASVANQNAMNKYNYDVANAQSQGGMFGTLGGLLGGLGGAALGSYFPGLGTAAGAGLGSALGGSIGSYAGGGSFAPTAGAGMFGSMLGSIGPEVFNPGAKTAGTASQGVSATAFGPTGQAFALPASSFSAPIMSPNWPYDIVNSTYAETFGGRGSSVSRGF
jgi:hypothetical protein